MESKPICNSEVVAHPHTTFNVAEGDYRPSCVGSCLCPCCGLVGTLCCCNTLTGKHGVADGCRISMAIGVVVAIIMGILVVTSAVDCKKDKTPKNVDEDACIKDINWQWNSTDNFCDFNGHCPSKYTFQNTTKDGVVGWCKNDDHYTCMGFKFKAQPWVSMAFNLFFLLAAVYYAKKFYAERLRIHQQTPPPMVYGTPVGAPGPKGV